MIRSFEFRLKPKAAQRVAMAEILAHSCDLYNAALQERRDAWKSHRQSIGYYDQQKQLSELRQDKDFARVALHIQREPLRRVDRAFKDFFRRVKSGQKPGYPRFRSQGRYTSFAWESPSIHSEGLLVPNLGLVRFKATRDLTGKVKQAMIVRSGDKWTARITCDIGPAQEKRAVEKVVGIDMGLTTLVALSDGQSVENPRWTKKHEDRIGTANRSLARKQRRSNNRSRAREALRRAHQRAANARRNYLHHVSKWLIANYDLIAHERLDVKGMAEMKFGKSIMDAAWAILLAMLAYKAENAGVHLVAVKPRGTSQTCSGCGAIVLKELWEREHRCPSCGLCLDRDLNAARNIKALGISAAGVSLQNVCVTVGAHKSQKPLPDPAPATLPDKETT